MKGKTLTETLWAEEADLNTYSATVSYMDFGLGGSGSGSGFGGGGYKGGISSHAGLRPIFDVPSITETFSFKPDARGPLPDTDFLSYLSKQNGIDSSFASAIKSSPSSFGSKYDIDAVNRMLEDSKRAVEALKNVMGGVTPSSFGCGAPSSFGSSKKEEFLIYGQSGEKGVTDSFKIFSSEVKAPLARLDLDGHHGMPKPHLQHLEKEFFGRGGNEAADIFADIFCKNTKIKFPWEK